MANKHPQLLEKISLASFLAPVAYVDHMKSPIRIFAPYASSLEVIFVKSQTDKKIDLNFGCYFNKKNWSNFKSQYL